MSPGESPGARKRPQAPGRADAYFDRAWGGVLANLGKRFDQGPQDWTARIKQLDDWRAEAARKAASPPK